MSSQTIQPSSPRPEIRIDPIVCRPKRGHVDCVVSDSNRIAAEWKPAPEADTVLEGQALHRRGQCGDSIRRLQADLERHAPGTTSLAVDGYFGPETEARVRAFQTKHGLAVDGIVGHETQAKLDELTMRDLLLDERFTRLPETTQRTILELDEDVTPEARHHLIAMITNDRFAGLDSSAQANMLQWRPLVARVALGV